MRILLLPFLVLFSLSLYAENIKIGYIDTENVVNNLPKYQKSVENLSKTFEPKKQELLALFDHIELLRIKIISIKDSPKQENLQFELSKLARLEDSFEKETESWQAAINNQKIQLLKEIELLINTAISEIAITENYDLILYENVAFVSDQIDITKKVIERIQ